jgi:hypothetical protein
MTPTRDWGWKVTVHAYGTGPIPGSEAMIDAANQVAEQIGADDFVGVEFKRVKKAPHDQVAT